MNSEEKIAKRMISYMGKEPELSADISNRLEFSRNLAVKNMKKPYKQEKFKFNFTLDFFKSRIVWAVGASMAAMLIIVSTVSMTELTQTSSINEEISYHVNADMLPLDFVSDEP